MNSIAVYLNPEWTKEQVSQWTKRLNFKRPFDSDSAAFEWQSAQHVRVEIAYSVPGGDNS